MPTPSNSVEIVPEVSEEKFEPSDKEKEVVKDVFLSFSNSSAERNMNYQYFDGSNLIDYINDSVKRFTTNIDERDDIEDWQARVHEPFTRNKVLAVLGKVAAVLPIAQFTGRGDEDIRKGIILSNLYEYAEDVDDYDDLMLHILLESIVKGTAIGYEGVDKQERVIRNIKGVNDNISVKEEKIVETKLFGSIVQLEEFYPSSVSIRSIKKMPYCFWRKVIPYSLFMQDWGMYMKSKYVQPVRSFQKDEDKPFYADFISNEIGEGAVELIRYYNKFTDQYVITANGIWLNPIVIGGERESVSPLPWNHKELPFWDIKFDIFGDFFYGKSLPDRLKSMQDVLNVLTNMLLDQSFLTIFPPLLTNGFDSIEDDYLRPGRRTPIDTQGLPISQSFMKLDLGTPSGWHQYILEYTRKIMEEASIDKVSQGVAGQGDRTTAQEIRVAAEGVSSVLGIYGRNIASGVKRKAKLKGSNCLQFYTDPDSPIMKRVGGDEVNSIFNLFKLDNAVLSGGKRGTKIIELYANKEEMPDTDVLKARATVAELEHGKKFEFVAMPGDYIRNFEFDVKLVTNPKSESSKDLEKALQLEKVRVYLSFFPDIINKAELAAETAEKMGDDPTKILMDSVFSPTPQGKNPELDTGVSQTPGQNTANNMVRGQGGGGDQQMAAMASLAGQMKG